MIKEIKVNWLDIKSIENAEKLKSQLENKGFKYKEIKKISFNKDILIYEK